jgi:Flp pilus assembly protein TadG
MRRASRWADRVRTGFSGEGGSAALEFLAVGLVLLVPLAYLVIAVGQVQSHALGVEATARHVAHTLARTGESEETSRRVALVVDTVAAAYGIDGESMTVVVSCAPAPHPCPAAGATLAVTVSATAALPFLPPVLGLDRAAGVPVEATAVQKVSRFWEGG